MELSHRVVMVLSAHVQRQTNKTASEMLSICLKFKPLKPLKQFNKSITTNTLMELKSFSSVESSLTRKYSSLDKISVHILEKYMHIVFDRVEKDIAEKLPDTFALIVDGWTEDYTLAQCYPNV